jgi:hypothetical protein
MRLTEPACSNILLVHIKPQLSAIVALDAAGSGGPPQRHSGGMQPRGKIGHGCNRPDQHPSRHYRNQRYLTALPLRVASPRIVVRLARVARSSLLLL